jgi:peptide/nickel transport system permease protein
MGRGADYLVKRAIFALVTVFVAITFNFVLFRLAPGDVVSNLARVPQATPALRIALRREFGLDKPKWDQYVLYLDQLAHGNLGISFQDQQPVSDDLRTAVFNTVPMVLLGVIIAIVLGVATGVIAAWRRGTLGDHASLGVALAFYAMPTQWLGLMLIILVAGMLPSAGMENEFLLNPSPWEHIKDVGVHMILPSMTLALGLFGQYAVLTRSAMLETFGEDYILTARAKGLSNVAVLWKHALRNALLPVTTLMALSLGYILGGAILVETVFAWPGIGRAVYQAVLNRDYPMLQGAFLLLTISVVFFNFVADVLYLKLDPRIAE